MSDRSVFHKWFGACLAVAVLFVAGAGLAPAQEEASKGSDGENKQVDPKALKNPIPHTKASVNRGKNIYLRQCQYCHGGDGRALENVDMEVTDLTDPKLWKFGSTDGEIFITTRDGRGADMVGFKEKLTEPQIWQVVNFVHSLRKDARPYVEPGAKAEPEAAAAEGDADAEELDPKKIKNPNPYTRASLKRGKDVYLRHCQYCHGADGRSLENVDFEAIDLTSPKLWRYGSTDGELFFSIRDGRGGDMPAYEKEMTKDHMWHLVNFLRSIGPKSQRPTLVEEPKS